MAPGPGLKITLRQRPALTAELQASVQLLQHSTADLHRTVAERIEANPLLDTSEPEPPPTSSASDIGTFDSRNVADVSWGQPRSEGFRRGDIEVSATINLRDYLSAQAGVDFRTPEERSVASLLIDLVDDNGYIIFDPRVVAFDAGVEPDEVEKILLRLQQVDPPGVFARSLAECLSLQLADRGRLNKPMRALLERLDRVAEGNEAVLAAEIGIGTEVLREMLEEIRSLDPRPGLAIGGALAAPIVPDVLVEESGNGWRVELNSTAFPRVFADRAGYQDARSRVHSKSDVDYLSQRWSEASWLVRSLRQRARTVFRIANLLIRLQDGFLRTGTRARRPLVLREIAELAGLHGSTVSRVVANKTMMTPRGMIPFRSFLDVRLRSTSGGGGHSSGAVQERIKNLVSEAGNEALSDREIALRLESQGILIARRTVAKYRGLMGIPSASKRKGNSR